MRGRMPWFSIAAIFVVVGVCCVPVVAFPQAYDLRDLAVGLGTFRPLNVDRVEDHVMHRERYSVPPELIDGIRPLSALVDIARGA